MTQPSLFDDPPTERLAYRGATATARACSRAAAVAATEFSENQEARVLAWWRRRGAYGGTDPECNAATGVSRASLCQRRRALMRRGLLVDSGRTRAHRVGKSARACTVYVAVECVSRTEAA